MAQRPPALPAAPQAGEEEAGRGRAAAGPRLTPRRRAPGGGCGERGCEPGAALGRTSAFADEVRPVRGGKGAEPQLTR